MFLSVPLLSPEPLSLIKVLSTSSSLFFGRNPVEGPVA
jgi:hypothetical protein